MKQYHYAIEDRFISSRTSRRPIILTTNRPIVSTTTINKIDQDVAVPSIRSIFPETWIFDLIDDTTLGYF